MHINKTQREVRLEKLNKETVFAGENGE